MYFRPGRSALSEHGTAADAGLAAVAFVADRPREPGQPLQAHLAGQTVETGQTLRPWRSFDAGRAWGA